MNAELLAPAGSPESVETALYFGADAVYVGGPFMQLRAEAAGLSLSDLALAAEAAHKKQKKLYVTVNCFASNAEIRRLGDYARELKALGADAAIVSDLGAVAEIREACPALDVHVSTQANVLNYRAAGVYRDMGVKRIVLGREMRLEEIAGLHEALGDGVELEAFVHGAMCMAYSGRCLLSSFLTGRSGNRGECAQPCRWNYYLIEEKRRNMLIPVTQEGEATAILSSADLKCLSFLDRLEEAGVRSFKIEGRMKSPYYVATAVNTYRQYMDGKAPPEACDAELDAASHRPYTTGFYFGEAVTDPNNDGRYRRTCDFIGVVREGGENGFLTLEMRNRFRVGDTLEILSPHSMGLSFTVESITGENGGQKTDADLVQELVRVNCPYPLRPGDMLRRRI